MVIWIIGMSASGKTTLGNELISKLKNRNDKWVYIDGDTFRNILGEDLGHSAEDRRKNAYRLSRLCKLLDHNGVNVLCCILSIFHDNQKYNRDSFSCYKEIYLEVGFEKLRERDNKGLYRGALEGKITDVVGVDIDFVPPYAPDIVIDNNADGRNFSSVAGDIVRMLNLKETEYTYSADNRLLAPETYQYSKYFGPSFLESYMDSRKKAVRKLESQMKRVDSKYFEDGEYGFLRDYYIEEVPSSKTPAPKKTDVPVFADTETLLTDKFLIYVLTGLLIERNISGDHSKIIFNLLKKFEVTKKLYSKYTLAHTKKAGDSYDEIANYALLALVLIELYKIEHDKYKKIILMNALLKLNDINVSVIAELAAPFEFYLLYFALTGEMGLTEALFKEKI